MPSQKRILGGIGAADDEREEIVAPEMAGVVTSYTSDGSEQPLGLAGQLSMQATFCAWKLRAAVAGTGRLQCAQALNRSGRW